MRISNFSFLLKAKCRNLKVVKNSLNQNGFGELLTAQFNFLELNPAGAMQNTALAKRIIGALYLLHKDPQLFERKSWFSSAHFNLADMGFDL